MARYDHNELCRCLTLAFTPNELDKLALSRGVYPPPQQAGSPGATGDTARLLVRALARRGELDQLVERLRKDKPLVEWPEPTEVVPDEPEVVPDEPAPEPAPTASSAPPPAPPAAAAGLTARNDGDEGPTRPSQPSEPDEMLPSTTAGPSPDGEVPWPGADEPADDEDEQRRRRLRMTAMVGAAALVVLVAVVGAFVAGRASTDADQVAPTPGAEAGPASLAGPAAALLEQSIQAVADTCALPDSDGAATDVLARGFRSCASRGEERAKRLLERRPASDPLAVPAPTATNTARPAGQPGDGRRAAEPRPRGSSCLDRCEQLHQSCVANECGDEPTRGSEYADYQRCLTQCLRKASQCRLRCG